MKQEPNKERLYQPLWAEIKKKKTCSIKPANTSVALFKRIRAAVIKEKCYDIAFKFELDQNEQRAKLEIERSLAGDIITFKLKIGIGLESI